MSKRVHIVVDDELLARVDAARGDVPRGMFVRRALEEKLGRGDPVEPTPAGVVPASPRAPRAPRPKGKR